MDLANWALWTLSKFTTGLNISSIRVFDQIRDSEIPIMLRPLLVNKLWKEIEIKQEEELDTFRCERATTDLIFCLRQLIQKLRIW